MLEGRGCRTSLLSAHIYSIYMSHGTDYKTGVRLCDSVCVCVCIRLWEYSHGRIFCSIFTKINSGVGTPKSKNEFAEVNISPPLPPLCSLKSPI